MLLGGDEIGRTQHGNNNAYCQDNEISWIDWEHVDETMLAFVQRIVALRRSDPVLRRRHFFSGQAVHGSGRKDIAWFLPSGREVSDAEWFDERQRSLGMILNGDEIPDRDPRGRRIRGGTLMVLLHAGDDPVDWVIPSGWGQLWSVFADTGEVDSAAVDPPAQPRRGGADAGSLAGRAPARLSLSGSVPAARRRGRRASPAPSPATRASASRACDSRGRPGRP